MKGKPKAIYSTADLARWTGLTRQAVAKATRSGPLKPAKVGRGRYDVAHPAARVWLEAHGVDVDALDVATAPERPSKEIAEELGATAGDSLDAIEGMTLRQVTDRYGSSLEFLHFTRARKELAAARRQERLLDALDERLIPKAVVVRLFDALATLKTRLGMQTAEAIGSRLAGTLPREEAVRIARERMQAEVMKTFEEMSRSLLGYDPATPPPPVPQAPRSRRDEERRSVARQALERAKRATREDTAPRLAEMFRKQAEWNTAGTPEEHASMIATVIGATLDRIASDFTPEPS